jgi:hypothetical protein
MEASQSEFDDIKLVFNKVKSFFIKNIFLGIVFFIIVSTSTFYFITKDNRQKSSAFIINSTIITPSEIKYKIDRLYAQDDESFYRILNLKDKNVFISIKPKQINLNVTELWLLSSESLNHDDLFNAIIDSVIISDFHREMYSKNIKSLENKKRNIEKSIEEINQLTVTTNTILALNQLFDKRESLDKEISNYQIVKRIDSFEADYKITFRIDYKLAVLVSIFLGFLLSIVLVLIIKLFKN